MTENYIERKNVSGFSSIQRTLWKSLLNLDINVLWLIKKHESLSVYPPKPYDWEGNILIFMSLSHPLKESEMELLPVFKSSSLNILVPSNGNDLDQLQDYDGNDGMV